MKRIVDRGELTIGVSYKNGLFGGTDAFSGEAVGFDIEIAREIGSELGLHPEQIRFLDILSDERLPVLQDGRVDLVVMALTITPAREELINFSRPYYLAGQSLLIRRSDQSISGLRDLAGKRICVVASSTGMQTLSQLVPDATLVPVHSAGSCVGEVLSGGVDAMSTDDVILAGFASQDDELRIVGGNFTQEPYGIGIPKANPDMVEFVNQALERMIEDGRWGRIYRAYLADIPGLRNVQDAKRGLLEGQR
jgi:ABC-type amino acid transport substrate-binding protein